MNGAPRRPQFAVICQGGPRKLTKAPAQNPLSALLPPAPFPTSGPPLRVTLSPSLRALRGSALAVARIRIALLLIMALLSDFDSSTHHIKRSGDRTSSLEAKERVPGSLAGPGQLGSALHRAELALPQGRGAGPRAASETCVCGPACQAPSPVRVAPRAPAGPPCARFRIPPACHGAHPRVCRRALSRVSGPPSASVPPSSAPPPRLQPGREPPPRARSRQCFRTAPAPEPRGAAAGRAEAPHPPPPPPPPPAPAPHPPRPGTRARPGPAAAAAAVGAQRPEGRARSAPAAAARAMARRGPGPRAP
ncbi:WAS/WASL-interacting protein family member 3-like [Zalophus californianus]|uniref:WAS/WASL-interacting protein family member 3-like n=1 Tax=Zalophus californianus TaxID=9704 RepID=A0A6P9FHG6_ZALCA|nr:WAS/WASL-interacting protein family member 3-like [Zalophus californianus]